MLNVIKGIYTYIYMIIQEESLCKDKLSPSIMIFILDTYKIQTESPLLLMPTFFIFCNFDYFVTEYHKGQFILQINFNYFIL